MVAMKALMVLAPFFLSMVAALPQDPATKNMLARDENNASGENSNVDVTAVTDTSAWKVSSSDSGVIVDFYKDKNPNKDTPIDPNTCKGQAEIALMKWRSNCKAFNAIFRGSCYTDAPSFSNCCPLYKSKSCKHYWPAAGE